MDYKKINNIVRGNKLDIRKPKDRQKIEEMCYFFAVATVNDVQSWKTDELMDVTLGRISLFVDQYTYGYLRGDYLHRHKGLIDILFKKDEEYNKTLSNIRMHPKKTIHHNPALLQEGYKIEKFLRPQVRGYDMKLV